jgi:hypothetical protein
MIEDFSQLYTIIGQTLLIFCLLYVLFRRQIFSVFDPLLYFIITQAFSIELGLLQIKDPLYLSLFLGFQLAFVLGFNLVAKRTRAMDTIDDEHLTLVNNEYKFWVYFTIIGFVVVVIANLYLFKVQGIILLSDDPTKEKVSAFEGGGGIGAVRRINWGLLNLINLSTIFLYIKTKKVMFLFMLIILILISVSGGSKSSLLVYVTILALLGQMKTVSASGAFQSINRLKLPLLLVGLVLSVAIIGANAGNLNDSILGLGIRFLYFGDIIFYYYNNDAVVHFQKLGIIDFLNYELNPILGILRIAPYLTPLSYELVLHSFAGNEVLDTVTGPNIPYYVKGHIFFGNVGGFIYSLLVGMLIAFTRNILFRKHSKYSSYLLLVFLNMFIFSYAQDSALMFSYMTDTFIFSLGPAFLALCCIYSPKLTR